MTNHDLFRLSRRGKAGFNEWPILHRNGLIHGMEGFQDERTNR